MNRIIIIPALVLFCCSFINNDKQPGLKAAIERGGKVYNATCIACHQEDGLGVQRLNPSLVKTTWVLGDKKQLIKIVLNGLKGGEIEIDGDRFHNPMPPMGEQLNDQQIADVLTYVRNSFGNKASLVSPREVKAQRTTTTRSAVKSAH